MQQRSPAPALAGAPDPALDCRIELRNPISGHRGVIDALELKQANYGDFIDCGPIRRTILQEPGKGAQSPIEVLEESDAIMRWACRLTGQPEAILRLLGAADAYALRREVTRIHDEFERGNSKAGPTN